MIKQTILLGMSVLLIASCNQPSKETTLKEISFEQVAVFTSTDKELENTYNWAKKMALSYVHDNNDPVGYWYEAALPQREAFCMRDVSHQSVGAQILGLTKHNKNMFIRFAENISEEKDWCTYWEINRYNNPAPADYTNDKEFWYNLNANFDIIQACFKIYEWTGDIDYLTDPILTNFFERSVNEYVERWSLEPENIMERPAYMNQPENFNPSNNFHACRGLPSYEEGSRGITLGADLLATMYAGFNAYANIADLNGNYEKAMKAREKAISYQTILDDKWWNSDKNNYQSIRTEDMKFHGDKGVPLILWFNATNNKDRIRASIDGILREEWNVENMSHFPVLLYSFGYNEAAYNYLIKLPKMNRSEYPEVSYGVIEGTVSGSMGIRPSMKDSSIETCSRLANDKEEAEIKNIPIFDGFITVKHKGAVLTEIENNTNKDLTWKVAFIGDYPVIKVGDKEYSTTIKNDIYGNVISEGHILLSANTSMSAHAYIISSK